MRIWQPGMLPVSADELGEEESASAELEFGAQHLRMRIRVSKVSAGCFIISWL